MDIDGKPVGYVFLVSQGYCIHYWFSFFDLNQMANFSIGKWMMWKSISLAKEEGIKYIYLGTCYGTKSLYKVRDFKGVEFFDGVGWNNDTALLKKLCKSDDETPQKDWFKTEPFSAIQRKSVGLKEKDNLWILP
jgi:arginine-tRNA-protein transferase